MARVLIAEDSPVTRDHLLTLLSEDPEISVVGTARDGLEAVEKTRRLSPDVVLMDVTMPRMDGYEATRRIMESAPVPIVMISSGFDKGGVATTIDALGAGAVAVVEKPPGGGTPDQDAAARQLRETVKLMAGVKVVRRWGRRTGPALPPPSPATAKRRLAGVHSEDRKVEIAAIGASTGGPAVLAEILGRQVAGIQIPILLVQHIARGFGAGLAAWLNEQTPLRVKVAEPYEKVQPGVVYLAPDDLQMGMASGDRIHLTDEPSESGFRPSISYTFRSTAARYGAAAVGILLTGMGQDGAAGLLRIREAGGATIVQDESSSVIFGMGQRAIQLGAAEQVLSPSEIARALHSLGSAACE